MKKIFGASAPYTENEAVNASSEVTIESQEIVNVNASSPVINQNTIPHYYEVRRVFTPGEAEYNLVEGCLDKVEKEAFLQEGDFDFMISLISVDGKTKMAITLDSEKNLNKLLTKGSLVMLPWDSKTKKYVHNECGIKFYKTFEV